MIRTAVGSTRKRLDFGQHLPRWRSAFVVGVILLGFSSLNARAGVYTDDLSKCLVKSTNTNDRVVLVQWMFAMLTLHPAVRSFVSVPDAQRDTASKTAAGLFGRLLTENCRKETVNALKYEGVAAIGSSFQVLGQVASRDLMTDSNVSKGMQQLGTELDDNQKLKDLLKDAGVAQKAK